MSAAEQPKHAGWQRHILSWLCMASRANLYVQQVGINSHNLTRIIHPFNLFHAPKYQQSQPNYTQFDF